MGGLSDMSGEWALCVNCDFSLFKIHFPPIRFCSMMRHEHSVHLRVELGRDRDGFLDAGDWLDGAADGAFALASCLCGLEVRAV